MDWAGIVGLAIGASAVGVSLFAALNARRAALSAAAADAKSDTIVAQTKATADAIDGRLAMLIASIQAKADLEVAAARSEAFLRENKAYHAGQENVRAKDPPATASALAELREVTVAGNEAALQARIPLGTTEEQPVHVHVVTDDSPVAVHLVPAPVPR